jgi:hypothetical protein
VPSRNEHLAKAELNRGLAEHLRELSDYLEWAIVAEFYRALHLIEADYARVDLHHGSHASRNHAVLEDMPDLWNDYADLDRLSRIARYDEPGLLGWGDFDAARAAAGRIEAYLRARP